jgi:DHA1 family bicyclomycin/chloramphenicol resistance-like MFS transporter
MDVSDSAAAAKPTPWGLIWLVGALTAVAPISVDMYLPGLPAIARDLHASPGATRATLAAFLAGMGIGQFFYGPLSDRIGRRPPLIMGAALYLVATAACFLAPSIETLIAARFVQALGCCAGQVVPRASVRDRFDHQTSARILSLLMLISGIGPIVAPLAGAALVTSVGWRGIFAVLGVASALIAILMLARFDESHSPEAAAKSRGETVASSFGALIVRPRLIGYMLSIAFNSGAFFAYISSAPSLLMEIYGFSPQAFSWMFTLNAAGFIAMSQVNAHLLRRYTPEDILARARAISIVFAAILALDALTGLGGIWGVLAPLFLVISSNGMVNPNTMAAALNVDPARAGAISSLMGGAMFGAGAVASVATGVFHDGTARPMALIIVTAVLASSAALYGLAKPLQAPA